MNSARERTLMNKEEEKSRTDKAANTAREGASKGTGKIPPDMSAEDTQKKLLYLLSLLSSSGLGVWVRGSKIKHIEDIDRGLRAHLWPGDPAPYEDMKERIDALPTRTMVLFADSFGCSYIVMKKKDYSGNDWAGISLGPFVREPVSDERVLSLVADLNLDEGRYEEIRSYYRQLCVLDLAAAEPVLLLVSSLFFGTSGIPIKSEEETAPSGRYNAAMSAAADEQKRLQHRYDLENAFLDVVQTANTRKALSCFSDFMEESHKGFSPRLSDRLRDRKDLLITLNTLLRKTAERTQVHPWHIDRLSNQMIARIEQISSENQLPSMQKFLIGGYCSLIREYSLASYSPIIRKAIDYINRNLTSPLTLEGLAAYCHVNASYLSARFKKETGASPIQYIKRLRVREAGYLLVTTPLSVRAVAAKVGFSDYNYFSRVFREVTGIAPSGYRKNP